MPKNLRTRRTSSSSSSQDESHEQNNKEDIKDKIEEIKFLQSQRKRTHGVDVYSLAIGESDTACTTTLKLVENDPWKSKSGGLVDMKLLKEKRGNEIVKNMHSTFAKETNQRDEDAEMQKFIEEQLRLKKEADKLKDSNLKSGEAEQIEIETSDKSKKYKTPQDVLFDVPKYLIESTSKNKSEETISEQLLSGIPEVDLGVDEKIRNIEETEKARQVLNIQQKSSTSQTHSQRVNATSSVNYVQHKRFDESVINADKNRFQQNIVQKPAKPEPVVGDAPKHELLQQNSQKRKSDTGDSKFIKHKKTGEIVERSSDDYCIERFKKNMRQNKNSKFKIS